MKNLQGFSLDVIAFAVWAILGVSVLVAQGPPVFLDSCVVTSSMKFKLLPVPGEFVPGAYESLRACPNLGNNVVKIAKAKVGKAKDLRIELDIVGGKLMRMQAHSIGKKSFEKLYRQVVAQAGRPSKMVESKGRLNYSWDLRYKLKVKVDLRYIPATMEGLVVITP